MVFSVDEEGMVFPNVVWMIRQNIGHWVVLISLIVNILWDTRIQACQNGLNRLIIVALGPIKFSRYANVRNCQIGRQNTTIHYCCCYDVYVSNDGMNNITIYNLQSYHHKFATTIENLDLNLLGRLFFGVLCLSVKSECFI